MPHLMFCACCETENCHFYATFPLTGTADTTEKRGEGMSLSSLKKPVLARFAYFPK